MVPKEKRIRVTHHGNNPRSLFISSSYVSKRNSRIRAQRVPLRAGAAGGEVSPHMSSALQAGCGTFDPSRSARSPHGSG